VLSADVSELVADADEDEFCNVRRAARSVRFAEEIAWSQGLWGESHLYSSRSRDAGTRAFVSGGGGAKIVFHPGR
jgi:hypothetical protein